MELSTQLLSVCLLESSSRDENKNKSDHETVFEIFSKSCNGLVALSVNEGENAAICKFSFFEVMITFSSNFNSLNYHFEKCVV